MKNRNNKKQQLDFGKDIEPLIKKYHLENNDDCKEAVELIKKDDPEGYFQLSGLLGKKCLTQAEEKTAFLLVEKAAEMGHGDAKFFLGFKYIVTGDRKYINKGLKLIKDAFSSSFSGALNKCSFGSKESNMLLELKNYFDLKLDELLEGVKHLNNLKTKKAIKSLIDAYWTVDDIYKKDVWPTIIYI